MIPRRGLLAGLGALLAAPAIIRTPGLLMPVKSPSALWVTDGVHPLTTASLVDWVLSFDRDVLDQVAFNLYQSRLLGILMNDDAPKYTIVPLRCEGV